MKGYRTIAFSIATILIGLIGQHIAPVLINEYLDVIFAGIGLGFLVLRLVTDTPFGAKIATDLGTTPTAITDWMAAIDPDLPANLNSAASDLNTAVGTLTGHLPVQQAALDALTGLVKTLASSGTGNTPLPQAVVQVQVDSSPTPLDSAAAAATALQTQAPQLAGAGTTISQ
jgi:hypothetical protein